MAATTSIRNDNSYLVCLRCKQQEVKRYGGNHVNQERQLLPRLSPMQTTANQTVWPLPRQSGTTTLTSSVSDPNNSKSNGMAASTSIRNDNSYLVCLRSKQQQIKRYGRYHVNQERQLLPRLSPIQTTASQTVWPLPRQSGTTTLTSSVSDPNKNKSNRMAATTSIRNDNSYLVCLRCKQQQIKRYGRYHVNQERQLLPRLSPIQTTASQTVWPLPRQSGTTTLTSSVSDANNSKSNGMAATTSIRNDNSYLVCLRSK